MASSYKTWHFTCKRILVSANTTQRDFKNTGYRLERPAKALWQPALIAASALVAVPSRADAFPLMVLQAFAAGKRVVATRAGGLPEMVAAPPNRLVEPDPDALARGLSASWRDSAESVAAADFQELAQLIHDVVVKGAVVKDAVTDLRKRCTEMKYCFTGREIEELLGRIHDLG